MFLVQKRMIDTTIRHCSVLPIEFHLREWYAYTVHTSAAPLYASTASSWPIAPHRMYFFAAASKSDAARSQSGVQRKSVVLALGGKG